MLIDPSAFRAVLGRYATGVTVVTTRGPEGYPVGLTVSSFTSVSLDPPLVLFCIDRSAGSEPVFAAADGFAVNILATSQAAVSARFADPASERFVEDRTVEWGVARRCSPTPWRLSTVECTRATTAAITLSWLGSSCGPRCSTMRLR